MKLAPTEERNMAKPKKSVREGNVREGNDMFVVVDGLKIARRGYPDTPQAGTWVSIETGMASRGYGGNSDHTY